MPFQRAWLWYRRMLRVRPFVTNSIGGATLMTVGDVTAQWLEAQAESPPPAAGSAQPSRWAHFSPARTATLAAWSALIGSPFWTWYYGWLPRILPRRQLVWVLFTAAVPAPIFNAAFFSFSTALEHVLMHPRPFDTLPQLRDKVAGRLREKWVDTVIRSGQVWIPVNLINFYFVPLDLRILFGSLVSFAWNIFLSLQQHATLAQDHTGAPPSPATATAAKLWHSHPPARHVQHARDGMSVAAGEMAPVADGGGSMHGGSGRRECDVVVDNIVSPLPPSLAPRDEGANSDGWSGHRVGVGADGMGVGRHNVAAAGEEPADGDGGGDEQPSSRTRPES